MEISVFGQLYPQGSGVHDISSQKCLDVSFSDTEGRKETRNKYVCPFYTTAAQ
jgi:hypothetical protein